MLNVRVLTKYAHLWEEFALTLENASLVPTLHAAI